jgi:hypothetical protein
MKKAWPFVAPANAATTMAVKKAPVANRGSVLMMTGKPGAFSSEVDTGSREENASKQKIRASVLIQSEPRL